MWNIIRLQSYEKEYENYEEFCDALRAIWKNFPQEKIDSLVLSYPRRLQECFEKKGDVTHY